MCEDDECSMYQAFCCCLQNKHQQKAWYKLGWMNELLCVQEGIELKKIFWKLREGMLLH